MAKGYRIETHDGLGISGLFLTPTMLIFRVIITALLSSIGLILPVSVSAFDVAILKSSDVSYYNEAVAGVKQVLAADASVTVYDLRGNVTGGRTIAQNLRAEQPDVIIAVRCRSPLSSSQKNS
jgi:putative tryptophan/tyrosine transport system substrate-binding protein